MSTTFGRLAGLPVEVDGYALERLERDVSSAFTRVSTVIRLSGRGEEGLGEDVTYDAEDHDRLQAAGAVHPLAGSHTLASFSELVAGLPLFGAPPVREASLLYRRWAFESAALDLALRQAGRSLADVLEREPRPLTYVVSLRLGEPPTIAPVRDRLDVYPSLRFKLDPTVSWTPELEAELAATGAVDSLDLKGAYKGSVVDNPADPERYRRWAETFPDAWLEDPDLEAPGIDEVLRPHRDRITWDGPIHAVADIEALPFAPRMVNVKPSRFGSLSALCAAQDFCAQRGVGAYGGGQFELGVGRGQIQYLASLFHPDTPNDVAPGGFNAPTPEPGLPVSPLPPRPAAIGFRWEG
ncbi:MAG TPA: hypothetical protein VK279_01390 [Solirubrobacteraceae bacterium]|nr:hypothetical protein [Solirubrobacteraceae bacterium]